MCGLSIRWNPGDLPDRCAWAGCYNAECNYTHPRRPQRRLSRTCYLLSMWGTLRRWWVFIRKKRLLHQWRVATNKQHTSDELRVKLAPLLLSEGIATQHLEGVALASVVPQLTQAWCAAVERMTGSEALVCSAEAAGGLFSTEYANPAEIGADRVADAVAAKALYGAPVVVVDFGTATNIEVIDVEGRFVGGVIAPGVETSAQALFSRATRLGAIELVDPHTAIGGNTGASPSRLASCTGRPTAWTGSCSASSTSWGIGRRWWPRAGWPPAWRRSRAPSPSRIPS